MGGRGGGRESTLENSVKSGAPKTHRWQQPQMSCRGGAGTAGRLARVRSPAFCYGKAGTGQSSGGEVTSTFSLPENATGQSGKASDWSFRRVKKKNAGEPQKRNAN